MATLRTMAMTALACGVVVSAVTVDARADGNQFTIGGQWWDQSVPEAKYDEFRQVPMGGFVESFMVREMAGRNSVALWGVNAIRSDQSTQLTWANGARWRLDLGYAQIPHTFSHIARWGWTEPAGGVFVLRIMDNEVGRERFELRPDGWKTKGSYDLFGQAKSEYEIVEQRDAAGLSLAVDPLGGAGIGYWEPINRVHGLDIAVVNAVVDPTFAFMTVDHDGRIRGSTTA